MSVQIDQKTLEIKTLRRCRHIAIDAPNRTVEQTITMYYEDTEEDANGNIYKRWDTGAVTYGVSKLVPVKMTIGGKEITGADVLQFILYFNDHREELLAEAWPVSATSASE